eukprot:3166536-Amphidinium_carterae.1
MLLQEACGTKLVWPASSSTMVGVGGAWIRPAASTTSSMSALLGTLPGGKLALGSSQTCLLA